MIKDQYDDQNLTLLKKFDTVIAFPEFVKKASTKDLEKRAELHTDCFADERNKLFPINTKSDAYLSQLYFIKCASEYPDKERSIISERLKESREFWGMDNEVMLKAASLEKTASDVVVSNINILDKEGNVLDTWSLRSPRDFEKAAIELCSKKSIFTHKQRNEVATQLLASELSKDASLSDEIDEYMMKAAGLGLCTKSHIASVIAGKAGHCKHVGNTLIMDKLASLLENLADKEVTPSLINKVASVLDTTDSMLGLNNHEDYLFPEEELYTMTYKEAMEKKASLVSLQNGKVLSKSDLTEDKLDRYFQEVVGEIPKVALEEKIAMLESMPSPDADDYVNYYA